MELVKQLYNILYYITPNDDVLLYAPPTNIPSTAAYYIMESNYSRNNINIASVFVAPVVAKAAIDLFNKGEQLQAYKLLDAASLIRYGIESYDPVLF